MKDGFEVRINDYALARKYPEYPVGLVGFPIVLDGWDLPNPAILGPSLYDHPMLAPHLMKDPRFRIYLVLAEWMYNMFYPIYGDKCVRWHAGIDTDEWTDSRMHPKDIDFLIYDKIRWNHDELMADLTVYPYTKETALLAGRIDGEQQSRGVIIPFPDLLIGATALSLGYQC